MKEKKEKGATGSIELICGPMFSGKTTKLLSRLNIRTIAKQKCLLIKYNEDTRYSVEKVVSHDGVSKDIPTMVLGKLSDLNEALFMKEIYTNDYEVIGIDEGQFFPDLVEYAEKFANSGKKVFVAALNGKFNREPWDQVSKLMPKCEYIAKCYAICTSCGDNADFSKRTSNSTEEKEIGGTDKYQASCRACFYE